MAVAAQGSARPVSNMCLVAVVLYVCTFILCVCVSFDYLCAASFKIIQVSSYSPDPGALNSYMHAFPEQAAGFTTVPLRVCLFPLFSTPLQGEPEPVAG